MTLPVGMVIDDRYEIVRVLGEGGLGKVLLAKHTRLGSFFAVKVLRPHVAHDADVVARFQREASACAQIRSDHVVRVVDVGTLPRGEPYLVMEYLDGETIAARIERCGPMDLRELTSTIVQILDGLASVHAAGVLHRDVKPANIVLAKSSHDTLSAKLVDFGVAKPQDGKSTARATRPGIVMGTPAYMSPEQVMGKDLDPRTDLFSLAVVAYEAATGKLPFYGELASEIMASIIHDAPVPIEDRAKGIDPLLATILHKALARDPRARYESAIEMRDVLLAWRTLAFADESTSESVERLSKDEHVRQRAFTTFDAAELPSVRRLDSTSRHIGFARSGVTKRKTPNVA